MNKRLKQQFECINREHARIVKKLEEPGVSTGETLSLLDQVKKINKQKLMIAKLL